MHPFIKTSKHRGELTSYNGVKNTISNQFIYFLTGSGLRLAALSPPDGLKPKAPGLITSPVIEKLKKQFLIEFLSFSATPAPLNVN